MLRHIFISFLILFYLSGCGDTYRQQLVRDYQRLVVEKHDPSVISKVCSSVIRAEFGKVKPGKISNSFISMPVKFVDERSEKTGKTVCYLTFITYDTYSEIFVQVSRHIAQSGSSSSIYSSGFKGTSHDLATPMESGENLPASRKIRWINIGRDRIRENRILSMIKEKLTD